MKGKGEFLPCRLARSRDTSGFCSLPVREIKPWHRVPAKSADSAVALAHAVWNAWGSGKAHLRLSHPKKGATQGDGCHPSLLANPERIPTFDRLQRSVNML